VEEQEVGKGWAKIKVSSDYDELATLAAINDAGFEATLK